MALKNPRHEKFCLEYSKNGNATEAYAKAFGTDNLQAAAVQASKLLRKNNIVARLKEINDEMSSARIMDVKEIQERLTAVARGEVTEEIILPKTGERVQKQAAVRDQLRALEILARINGLFIFRAEVTSTAPIVISGGDKLED